MDIYDPLAARTRPTTATAETRVQQPRTTASSTYRAASSAYQTPQTNTNTDTQDQQQPSQEPPMPNDQNMPTPLAPAPCSACATPPHWPWIIALLVGGGLGWYIGSRKKSRS